MEKAITERSQLDQLNQLTAELNELFRRAKNGVYDDISEVISATQLIKEGEEPVIPVCTEKFIKWRSFFIGGSSTKTLLRRIRRGCEITPSAKDLMKQKAFTTLPVEEEIETIILTPADFGYESARPAMIELFNPVRLTEWNKKNAYRLPKGYVVDLLPAEAGPHIRD